MFRSSEKVREEFQFSFKDCWGGLASLFCFALFIFLLLFPEKLQHYYHDLEKALFINSCIMDLQVKQVTRIAKNSSILMKFDIYN